MKGGIWCEGCEYKLYNKRGLITPCDNKWDCQTYMNGYNKEQSLREAIKTKKLLEGEDLREQNRKRIEGLMRARL